MKNKPVWEKPRPKSVGKPQKLSPEQKASAKAAAKKAGRPYPNLVDNIRAAKKWFLTKESDHDVRKETGSKTRNASSS